jgi:hypothetical protein
MGYIPSRPFEYLGQLENETDFGRVYDLIKTNDFLGKTNWIENSLACMPISRIQAGQIDDLVEAYRQPGWNAYPRYTEWSRFLPVEPAIFFRALSAIEENNRSGQSKIFLLAETLMEAMGHLAGDMDLAKRVYFQQAELAAHFDATYGALSAIVSQEPHFLLEYFRYFTAEWRRYRDHSGIAVLWSLPQAEVAITDVFEEGMENDQLYRTQGFYPYLFKNVPKEFKREGVLVSLPIHGKMQDEPREDKRHLDLRSNGFWGPLGRNRNSVARPLSRPVLFCCSSMDEQQLHAKKKSDHIGSSGARVPLDSGDDTACEEKPVPVC